MKSQLLLTMYRPPRAPWMWRSWPESALNPPTRWWGVIRQPVRSCQSACSTGAMFSPKMWMLPSRRWKNSTRQSSLSNGVPLASRLGSTTSRRHSSTIATSPWLPGPSVASQTPPPFTRRGRGLMPNLINSLEKSPFYTGQSLVSPTQLQNI